MAIELLTAKLFIPPLRSGLVPRPRLTGLLNEGPAAKRKLTLVSAPAGFGKTTLVVDWLNQVGLPVAWLTLDEADNDLARFLAYLAAAFQAADEEIGGSVLGVLQAPQLPPIEKVLAGLLNEIAARTDPLILVLDDFHLLHNPVVLQVMGFLLEHLPPQLHLVLTTREDPDLPLSRLRAQDRLTEIRAGDLRFTRAETQVFLGSVMGLALSDQDVAALEDRTEGWAVGLQLAALSMQRRADLHSFIGDFSGSHRHILDYLTDEVMRQQPEDTRAFMLQTAVLNRLCGPLCDALTGRTDSGTLLARLEAANLFLIPLDEERRWYRYHHLFSDLLRNQLSRSQPALIPVLHRRASCWYEEHGQIHAAVDHALRDSDLTRAADLIERNALLELYGGRVTVVLSWLERLPEAVVQAAPMLCLYHAWALALMKRDTRRAEVERALQAAGRALETANSGAALRSLVAGHAATIRAYLLRSSALTGENPDELIALSQEAVRLLPEQERAIRSVNGLNIGYGYLVRADIRAAELAYEQTLADGLAGGNLYAAIYGPINLVLIALLAGRLNEALHLCETNIERFQTIRAGQSFPPFGALNILKGSILLEYGCLAEAEPTLLEGLDSIRWTGDYEAPYAGYTALARLRAIQGDRPAMLEAVQALAEAWPEGVFYAEALRHRLLMRHWPTDPDVQRDARTWWAQSGIEFGKLPVIHSVVPMSMAHFESYLAAAHVLARLAPGPQLAWGQPGAYPLQDVHAYLQRQHDFAAAHDFAGPVVQIAIARTLLYEAAGKKHEALKTLEDALARAAPTGLFRAFVDECDPLRALLEELRPRLAPETLIAYADRLLEAMTCEPVRPDIAEGHEGLASEQVLASERALLSERELDVLRHLARGLTYEEIGRQLFLSLNTVQFHVKNIYGKLLVNRRVQAIEKAREMHLI
jgi:LuxR family transcriptional regulator, maltose regulon positive regulatory protein